MQNTCLSLVLSVDFRIISLWFLRCHIFTLPFRNSCISGTPARWRRWCGSTGGNVRVHLPWERLDRWHSGLTQRDSGPRRKSGGEENKTTHQTTTESRRVTLLMTASWCVQGRGQSLGRLAVEATWHDGWKTHGTERGRWGVSPLLFSLYSLSVFLTHACTQTFRLGPIHLLLSHSINLIFPTMLPPTFPPLFNSFSFPSSLSLALSRLPLWAASQSRGAAARAWLRPASDWQIKKEARGGKRWRDEQSEWHTRRGEAQRMRWGVIWRKGMICERCLPSCITEEGIDSDCTMPLASEHQTHFTASSWWTTTQTWLK